MNERKIKNLLSDNYRVYLYFESREIINLFVKSADSEGFRYGDGVSLFEREPDDIMAINNDFTINFLGFAGHMCFHHPETATFNIVRIDYAKYASGEKNYIYCKKP